VQVSLANAALEHNEVILAADLDKGGRLLAGSMSFDPHENAYKVVTYVSFDNGLTWKPTLDVDHGGDPATAFGCEGTAFSISLISTGRSYEWKTVVHRSKDGGKTWPPPTILPYSDREYITVDCTKSEFRGRVYIHGNVVLQSIEGERISGVRFFVSEDGGQSFTEKTLLPATGRRSTFQGNGVVLSDGTFLAPFRDIGRNVTEDSLLRVISTEDGGVTFLNAVTISQRAFGLPSLAVDQSAGPFRDRIYAVWLDTSSGRSQIVLAYSVDKGKTWSRSITVNDDSPFPDGRRGPDDFMPVVAVNSRGVVGVSWYDRRDSINNRDWNLRFAASLDGGKSFLPSVRVSDSPFTHDWGRVRAIEFRTSGGGNYDRISEADTLSLGAGPTRAYSRNGGDTAGLAAGTDGLFHALWIDNRTGTPQVWTAQIAVNGEAIRNDSHGHDELEDITRKVTFEFSDTQWNSETATVSAKAYLVNTSDETITGPLLVRAMKDDPTVEILNADNRLPGKGASWDYTSLLTNNRLGPGQRTVGKLMQFRLLDRKGIPENAILPSLRSIAVEVFGKVQLSK